jgi:hypothetical protein
VAINAGFTVRFVVAEVDPVVAVTSTVVTLLTDPADAANVWLAAPAGTATVEGKERAPGSSLDRLTATPAAGAFPVRTTVPVVT